MDILETLEGLGFSGWDTAIDWREVSSKDTSEAVSSALAQAQGYAEMAEYVTWRTHGYDHETAMAKTGAYLKRVRKALGFSRP